MSDLCNKNKRVLDLGFQPLADDLKSTKSKLNETVFYPLNVNLCRECYILQTGYIVGDNRLYPKEYHYTPESQKCSKNFDELSSSIIKLYNLNKQKDLLVDLGCNDGSLLYQFKKGFRNNVGVDPTNTIKIAEERN